MKQFIVNNKEINIKTELSEITVGEYSSLLEIFNKEYDSKIDLYTNIISTLSNATIDDIEELPLEEFVSIIPEVQVQALEQGNSDYVNKIIINDITYKTSLEGNEYKFNVKQMKTLESVIKTEGYNYISDLAAIVFREVLPNGSLGDLSTQSINIRKEIFKNNMTMDIITPYIISLSNNFKLTLPKIDDK
jgi:hypothetical protein